MAKAKRVVSCRRELFDYLSEQMNASYRQVLQSGKLKAESTYVKTFILEFDWAPSRLRGISESEFLADALTIPGTPGSEPVPPTVTATEEAGFYQVDWRRKRGLIRVYLDTITDPDRRFWLAYSLSDAAELDIVLDRLASSQANFDRTWFWPSLLQKTQRRGEFRGIGLDYDYRRFEQHAGNRDSTNYLKMQIWGGPETEQVLGFVSQAPAFRDRIVLAKIRMKYWLDSEANGDFAIEDIKYNGKFTTRGTSFDTHQALVSDLRSEYAEAVRRIESLATIHITQDADSEAIAGDPLFFDLKGREIEDLDLFCDVVFSGGLPFRLWGLVQPMPGGDEGRHVTAVDMHTGSRLCFEVYPDIIAVYLYPGACGNTVARFFTNLQHGFSRTVSLEDNDGNEVL